MIQQRANFDWMLKELYDGVPGIEMIVVLSADGLRIARYAGDPDAADRVAAACAGLQSLAGAVAQEIPTSDGEMNLVVIEMNGGYFYLMAAGANAYLAVLADVRCEPGHMSANMRDLVVRIGSHLTSPPRHSGQTV
ncbi:roadblock/LC7 domain-containing protein [Streptomyces longwoodensis]|uniref:Roadblock/LC7 domain-containing protein n=1 Tax=Streptomyces lasalocidi TaxID=324833 RepID=A0A4U5WDS9_STRLS|nr:MULTISPECIES: roadblock/LC7 domain-containing protein [Streptomyces]TKS99888.1 roadblock/LC7 domain-containing protein [Streptomyces lasalocidi]WRY87676.1 roadblock/LC7 domain-containing protein [Streptomyces longwoodensis]WTI48036.1 roadblock/LC7 domain-containing protein [Streptomyces longwoodensis]WUC60774.1 roadblock/LC7 domain-containing protein [Streptomyces longwoodensis]WUC74307.1 roadblock/LC7 domain-containing protein [Streptomyces longwoodensis]